MSSRMLEKRKFQFYPDVKKTDKYTHYESYSENEPIKLKKRTLESRIDYVISKLVIIEHRLESLERRVGREE